MNKTTSSPMLLLTPIQASKALNISARKLWSLTASDEIPAVRIGRSVRYDPSDLRAFIEKQKKGVRPNDRHPRK